MILACGVCTHWILWTKFTAATPWAVVFTAWFGTLAVAFRSSESRPLGIPNLPWALVLVVASLLIGLAALGPLAGWWFAPSCIVATLAGIVNSNRASATKRLLASVGVLAVATLAGSGYFADRFARGLSKPATIAMLQDSPAWPIALRKVKQGDCAALRATLRVVQVLRVAAAVEERLNQECPKPSMPGHPVAAEAARQ